MTPLVRLGWLSDQFLIRENEFMALNKRKRARVLKNQRGKCFFCDEHIVHAGWTIHHIIHKSEGGKDNMSNLAAAHNSCHKKHHKIKEPKIKLSKRHHQSTIAQLCEVIGQKDFSVIIIIE